MRAEGARVALGLTTDIPRRAAECRAVCRCDIGRLVEYRQWVVTGPLRREQGLAAATGRRTALLTASRASRAALGQSEIAGCRAVCIIAGRVGEGRARGARAAATTGETRSSGGAALAAALGRVPVRTGPLRSARSTWWLWWVGQGGRSETQARPYDFCSYRGSRARESAATFKRRKSGK